MIKYIAIGILITLFCINGSGSFVRDVEVKNLSNLSFDENIFYVGGNGPNNYTTIQGAIDDASDGDMVFVYDESSPYYENLIVDVSIDLIGEDEETTVIDGTQKSEHVVEFLSDNIYLSGFTIKNCSGYFAGVGIKGENNHICGSIITENSYGIILFGVNAESDYNYIIGNVISNNAIGGIRLDDVSHTVIANSKIINNTNIGIAANTYSGDNAFAIQNNIIADHEMGIWIGGSNSIISNNIVRNNPLFGIRINGDNNDISDNTISNHTSLMHAALVIDGFNNTINCNNFFNNTRHAKLNIRSVTIWDFLHTIKYTNDWDENYWDETDLERKLIIGFQNIHIKIPTNLEIILPLPIFIPKFNIDRHPASEPYHM